MDRDLNLIDTFQRLVRPEEPITAFITEITSITPEMREGQPLWKEVASEFEAWVVRHCNNIKRVRLSAWGNYFDMTLLRRANRARIFGLRRYPELVGVSSGCIAGNREYRPTPHGTKTAACYRNKRLQQSAYEWRLNPLL